MVEKQARTERPTVLFVDDEPDVLAAMRSGLRRERKRFDFRFAVGGADALTQLEESPAAVIISDMRMPGMSGAELLERAKVVCPESVRIVLTGEAEREHVLRSLPVAHQWLSKPCDRNTVLTAIEGAVRYRDLLTDSSLKRAIANIDGLASPPALYAELLQLAAESTTSIAEIADIAGRDPAIAAKLVQLANSAFCAGSPVTDLHGAVVRVGLENLCHMVLSVELSNRCGAAIELPGLDISTNARLSELAATYAPRWATRDAKAAGLAALLHNVGLLIEAQLFPDRLMNSYTAALETGNSLVAHERSEYGTSHLEIAGHLLSIWGVPSQVVLAVVDSHSPMLSETPDGTVFDAVRLGVRAGQRELGAAVGRPHLAPTTVAEMAVLDGLQPSEPRRVEGPR